MGTMAIRIFVPRDSTALALGADEVAAAIAEEAARRQLDIDIVRNGTRGLLWLEPLVEVETAAGRTGFGEVTVEDVGALFDAGFHLGQSSHRASLGLVEEIPYLKEQQRLTFARTGITDPLSLADYEAHGGYEGLRRALTMEANAVVDTVIESGLRGRGGAAFPTGIKWKTVSNVQAQQKYVVCNADEGDSGTFADRIVMEGDPFVLIEGMTIAAIAVGASKGYIYVRSEYPHAIATSTWRSRAPMKKATSARTYCGSGKHFDLEVRKGAALISAARKRRCWKVSKASAAWCVPSRRCLPSRACSASRP